MAVRTDRLQVLVAQKEDLGDHAKIPLHDLDHHIDRILDIATVLDEKIDLSLRELGVDPDEVDSDLNNGHMILDMAYCRNLAENMYDELVSVKELALVNIQRDRAGTNH